MSDTDTGLGRIILCNMVECGSCGDIIESKHVHDFVRCSCGGVYVDGGSEYLRRGWNSDGDFTELSLVFIALEQRVVEEKEPWDNG